MFAPCLLLCVATVGLATPNDAAPIDFARDVQPLLADRCLPCHGPDAAARQADLRLDRRPDAILAAITPGDAAGSPMITRAASRDEDLRMPPPDAHQRALSAGEVDVLRRWIDAGAEYPAHWSYAPLGDPRPPAVTDRSWARDPLDHFVLARLEEKGVRPSPEADRRTLLRRAALDLTGLPPTAAEVREFLADPRADAFERAVDRLLATDAHAERMAVWWLDLVRYGDSSGYHSDRPIPVWPYRDYVIRAFRDNLPFDRFTVEQLAGDLLPEPTDAQRVAAIYNRLSKMTDEGGAQAGEYVVKYAADRVRTTASVWLGATMGCAECHDHKYDPIPQRDFYRLAAFFADVQEVGVYELRDYRDFQPRMTIAWDGAEVTTLATVAVEPREVRVLARGDWLDESGEVVTPGVSECWPPLRGDAERPRANRLDLARWLVRDDHPLTARVLVNRLWYLFFGEGLAPVLDDLGRQGAPPSHPRLLDRLARDLVASGWDVRATIRRMVTSATYRQSSAPREDLRETDPANRWLARQGRWRLDAEFVRDTALSIGGRLDPRVGGPSVFPYQPAGYWQHLNFPPRRWSASAGADQHRRGLYTHWQRTFVHPALLALDAPTREESCTRRARSNTPLSALVLLNDPSFVDAARAFADRVLAEAGPGDDRRLDAMFRLAVQREPSADERAVLRELLDVERGRFAADPEAAQRLAVSTDGPRASAAGLDAAGLDAARTVVAGPSGAAERAAWTQVARAVLNLHETVTRP